MNSTVDSSRKKSMEQDLEEAHFTEIQEFAKTGDKDEASQKLIAFAKRHDDSKLSQDASMASVESFTPKVNL